MNKKYALLPDKTVRYCEKTLYQIMALEDICERGYDGSVLVEAGTLGGYVESESCLSTDDRSWIDENVWLIGETRVMGNSTITSKKYGVLNIIDSVINGSELHDREGMTIIRSTIKNSELLSRNFFFSVEDSTITNSECLDSSIYHSEIKESSLTKTIAAHCVISKSNIYNSIFETSTDDCFKAKITNCDLNEVEVVRGYITKHQIELNNITTSNVRITKNFKDIIGINVLGTTRTLTAYVDEETNEILYNIKCQTDINEEYFKERIFNDDGIKSAPHRVKYLAAIEAAKVFLNYKYEENAE